MEYYTPYVLALLTNADVTAAGKAAPASVTPAMIVWTLIAMALTALVICIIAKVLRTLIDMTDND